RDLAKRNPRRPQTPFEGVSGLELVQKPAYLSIALAPTVVVTHKRLIDEDASEYLGSVVIESAMPDALIQLEHRFEPLVEWFNCFLPPTVQARPSTALEKLQPLSAQLTTASSA